MLLLLWVVIYILSIIFIVFCAVCWYSGLLVLIIDVYRDVINLELLTKQVFWYLDNCFSDAYFDKSHDKCYCTKCHASRNEKLYYTQGDPAKDYALPTGWTRFALRYVSRDAFSKCVRVQFLLTHLYVYITRLIIKSAAPIDLHNI